MTEDAESGMMQSMVTITHNDMSPEMLAAARRGPFAAPTDSEMIEYLMQRVISDSQRPRFEELGSMQGALQRYSVEPRRLQIMFF